jgi:hypothetical protein
MMDHRLHKTTIKGAVMRINRKTIFMFLTLLMALVTYFLWVRPEGSGGSRSDFAAAAQQAIEAQGYTNVQYTGVDSVACGDTAGFAFDADNVNHVRVHLVACSADGLVNYAKGWQVVTR